MDAIVTEFPDGVLEALGDQAGTGPGQIKIACWDLERSQDKRIALTAICDYEAMGERAAQLVTKRLQNPNAVARRILVFPKIVDQEGKIVEDGPLGSAQSGGRRVV